MTFEYLKKFVDQPDNKASVIRNWFYSFPQAEIEESERIANIRFPLELRKFYKEIGYGSLTVPNNPPDHYDFSGSNYIYSPKSLADFLVNGPEDYMIDATYELLSPGDLPFFEVGDSDYFLVMKLNSDNPNAVYDMGNRLIEESFEKFIWNLYYNSPSYYMKDW
jgi:hypothetical protein